VRRRLDRYDHCTTILHIKHSSWAFGVGILSACELLEQLAHHRVIPKIFLRGLPKTKSPYVSVLSFIAFSGVLYASAGANLTVISQMQVSSDATPIHALTPTNFIRFSLVWLTVMSLFPIALLLLKFNRGRLSRDSQTPLSVIIAALAISAVVFAGNIAVEPATAGLVPSPHPREICLK
jgi:amino acid transporter